jgi:DNA primase
LRDPRSISLSIFGCLLDFPELLENEDTREGISLLEGDVALAVAALRQSVSRSGGGDAAEILAHLPGSIHTFAAQRLAAPRREHPDEARMELLQNAQKLKRLGLSKANAESVVALHRMQGAGDAAAEDALLRKALRRARQRHGLEKG